MKNSIPTDDSCARELQEIASQSGRTPPPPLPAALSLEELLKEEEEPDVPVIKGLFDCGRKVQLVGKAKIGKSYLGLTLATRIAAGVDLCGLEIPFPRRCLYVNFELHKNSIRKRMMKILNDPDCALEDVSERALRNMHFLNLRGVFRTTEDLMNHIAAEGMRVRAEVIFLDPLYLLIEGNENDSECIRDLVQRIDAVIEQTAAAFVYVHHDTKGNYPGERLNVDRGSGSGLLGRHWDAQIVITAHANSVNTFVVEFSSRDYEDLPPITLERKDGCLVCSNLAPIKRTRNTDRQQQLSHEDKDRILREAGQYVAQQVEEGRRVTTAAVARYIQKAEENLSGRMSQKLVRDLEGFSAGGKRLHIQELLNHQNYFVFIE